MTLKNFSPAILIAAAICTTAIFCFLIVSQGGKTGFWIRVVNESGRELLIHTKTNKDIEYRDFGKYQVKLHPDEDRKYLFFYRHYGDRELTFTFQFEDVSRPHAWTKPIELSHFELESLERQGGIKITSGPRGIIASQF